MNVQFLKGLKKIDQNRFNQEEGTYSNSNSCCFGAHLAHILLDESRFFEGKAEFKRRLGNINDAQVFLLFKKAGLDVNNPFSNETWNISVKQVIENLEKIEEIPDLKDADLASANLRDANLRGADLASADLIYADLRGADLRGADLRDANLKNANLRDANLRGANLRDANLRGADLASADLRDANLKNANLRDANLRGANLASANLEGAKDFILSNKQKKEIK